MPFTTPTGQTGLDAYTFEAAAIANAQRELDARFQRLRAAVKEEHPELFVGSTDYHWAGADKAESFSYYIRGRETEYLAPALMQLGFTGTQRGMTERQKIAVGSLLDVLGIGHVHHGDCIGADAEFHALARERGFRVEVHPPLNESKRAFCDADIRWPPYEYLVRNHHIVDCSGVLIAAPGEEKEILRSGTWATVRYASITKTPFYIVRPDGSFLHVK